MFVRRRKIFHTFTTGRHAFEPTVIIHKRRKSVERRCARRLVRNAQPSTVSSGELFRRKLPISFHKQIRLLTMRIIVYFCLTSTAKKENLYYYNTLRENPHRAQPPAGVVLEGKMRDFFFIFLFGLLRNELDFRVNEI